MQHSLYIKNFTSSTPCSCSLKFLEKLFTLHRKNINICNLETCTGEESAPLFITLHPKKICVNPWNLWDVKKWFQPPDRSGRASVSISCVIQRWRVVKSCEEWTTTLHLSQPQCLSGFQPIWWRVKSKKVSCCLYQLPTCRFVPGNGSLLPW